MLKNNKKMVKSLSAFKKVGRKMGLFKRVRQDAGSDYDVRREK